MSLRERLAKIFWSHREKKETMKPDKIIVGLGNPGSKYKGTRHNAGFMVLAKLAEEFALGKPKRNFQSESFEVQIGGQNILLLCPLTYMNLSGEAVGAVLRFYKLSPESLLVVSDDVDLPVGKIRLRDGGGSGGQRGVKDIIARVGSDHFSRLRIGIGRPPEDVDTADYVLSEFRTEEKETIQDSVQRGAKAAVFWVENGIAETMNQFNGDSKSSGREKKEKREKSNRLTKENNS